MTAPYICVRCRYRVVRLAQQTRDRGFVSLSRSSSQPESRQPDNAIPRSAASQHGTDARTKTQQRRNAIKRTTIEAGRATPGMDSVLEKLFTSSQKTQSAPTKTRYSGTIIPQAEPRRDSPKPPDLDGIARLSKQFYEDKMPLRDVWRNCERLLLRTGKNVRMDRIPRQADDLFRDILLAINRHYFLSDDKQGLPQPHQAINFYGGRAIMRCWWNDVLWFQLAELLNILQAFDAPQLPRDDLASRKKAVLLMQEIMYVWSEFTCRYGPPAQQEVDLNEAALPPISNHAWFLALLPKHRRFLVDDRILAACKLTHQILKELIDVRRFAIPMTHHRQTLVKLLGRLVEGRTFSLVAAEKSLTQEGVQRETIDRWLRYSNGWGEKPIVYESTSLPSEITASSPHMPLVRSTSICEDDTFIASLELREEHPSKSIQAIECSLENDHERSCDKASRHRAATTIIKDLERAVDRFDVARVAGIWQEYQRTLAAQEVEPRSREEIFIRFLTSFIALSRQEQAVHVWNDMLQCGVTPNQRHWNAMLHGASKARDVASLDEIWSGMLATGIEPDLVSWTTYINGLIMCKKDLRGLQALNDLGRIWKKTTKDQKATSFPQDKPATEIYSTLPKHDATKPSLAPVQAAVGALLRIGKEELCWPLLAWAESFSIPLTTGFFNVILRYAVRQGDAPLINRTFSLMDANNCSEDEQTYTILLNGHMSNINSTFPDLSLEEQELSVLRILDDMTAKNVSIDQRTYGTILYGLLNPKNDKRNDQAARAVLDHMNKHDVKPSHYIYSILASHYFSLSPPDLQAVENIWKRIKIERPILDREFYERLVEGYAAARFVERMLYFLRRIPHEGKSPTWNCLSVVLNTLIQVGEWGLVKELITDVKDRRSGLRRFADEGWKGGRAEEEFWVTVDNIQHRIEELG